MKGRIDRALRDAAEESTPVYLPPLPQLPTNQLTLPALSEFFSIRVYTCKHTGSSSWSTHTIFSSCSATNIASLVISQVLRSTQYHGVAAQRIASFSPCFEEDKANEAGDMLVQQQ